MNFNSKLTKVSALVLATGMLVGANSLAVEAMPVAGAANFMNLRQLNNQATTTASSTYTTRAGASATSEAILSSTRTADVNGAAAPAADATESSEETTENTETTETTEEVVPSGVSTAATVSSRDGRFVVEADGDTISSTDTETGEVSMITAVRTVAVDAANEYANIGIATVTDYVNVRSEANTDSDVVGKLYTNNACNVDAEVNGWYKITSGNIVGYVSSDYVSVGDTDLINQASRKIAKVNTETLYVREDSSTDSSVIDMVPLDEDLTVVDDSTKDSGWVKVSVNGEEGYVSTEFVGLTTEYTYGETKEEEEQRLANERAAREAAAAAARRTTGGSSAAVSTAAANANYTYSAPSGSNGSAVVAYASQFLGNPYVYGGSSLTNGTDCSGFVMSVYRAFGVSLPHSSAAQRGVGYGVTDMQPGDIVCYSGHVGIYAGGGSIINASTPSTGIIYSNVNYAPILAVRRIF